MLVSNCVLITVFIASVIGKCYEPSPAFPVPEWESDSLSLKPAFEEIESKLINIVSKGKYDNSSYSIEVTSAAETLWGTHHTARRQDKARSGEQHVDSSSQYRIASITKVFTTLAVLYQHKAGNLSLDDPVLRYIGALNSPEYELPWKDITIRILASQLSGIPREFAQSDLLHTVTNPELFGLPPADKSGLLQCDYSDNYKPCNDSQLLDALKTAHPLFAPNQKSTYGNVNFELLGLVLENTTGMPYEDYISASILEPLNMSFSSLEKPSDEHAVLPLLPDDEANFWDIDLSVMKPTGGIYASSSDLSKLLRYMLTHYNTLATGVNWLMPASWGTGMHTFYGMPFETFRTDKILPHSRRPVTFVTKSGGLPGYYSVIILLEEYGLGITLLVGGSIDLLDEIREAVTVELVRAAEEAVWRALASTHTGSFVSSSSSLNSSMMIESSPAKGLHLSSFISNGTDVLTTLFPRFAEDPRAEWRVQLVPTLLFADEEKQEGEIWRALVVQERGGEGERSGIWDDFCVTDVDGPVYAGKPVNEVVFWHEERTIELPAWRVSLQARAGEKLVVQG